MKKIDRIRIYINYTYIENYEVIMEAAGKFYQVLGSFKTLDLAFKFADSIVVVRDFKNQKQAMRGKK